VSVTRRAFFAMLGAAAALLQLRGIAPRPAAKPTLWIGHF
jgi:hypothetical protein